MVSAVVAFAVNFLAASRDVDFKWYVTWNVFLGPTAAVSTAISSIGDAGVVVVGVVGVVVVVVVRIAWNAANALDELA